MKGLRSNEEYLFAWGSCITEEGTVRYSDSDGTLVLHVVIPEEDEEETAWVGDDEDTNGRYVKVAVADDDSDDNPSFSWLSISSVFVLFIKADA